MEMNKLRLIPSAGLRQALRNKLGRDFALGYLLLLPLVIALFGLLAYPIATAISITFQDKVGGLPGRFIGLENYRELLFQDRNFWRVVQNGFIFTFGSVVGKLIVGMIMALVLNRRIVLRGFFRGLLLLPWVAPTVVTSLAWRWIFELMGVLNHILKGIGLIQMPIPWLARYGTAVLSVVTANVWRGFPFFGVTLLAGMQTIPPELYEAAEVDGASVWQRFWSITLPSVRTVILVVCILSTIWTFNDFTIVWLMTRGGPGNATDVFATYTYKLGFITSRMGYGETVSMILTPVLIIVILILSPLMLRGEDE